MKTVMLKSLRVFVGLGVALASVGLNVGVSHATPDGEWSTFENVPGLVDANAGQNASFASVSCASAGNCSAGGHYVDVDGHQQAFVVSQVDGVWQTFEDVPGLVAANTGGGADVVSVSCTSAGNCSAGGNYKVGRAQQAFVVSQVDGVWQTFEDVPGLVAANAGGGADVISVSCSSAGNCSAGGFYSLISLYNQQAFVVSQVDGVWQTFEDVPGLVVANTDNNAKIFSISCASAGNCSAGGKYKVDGVQYQQGFVVSQVDGVWQTFEDVRALAAIPSIVGAVVNSVSCASAGNCSAVGQLNNTSYGPVFVMSQVNGVWGNFEYLQGLEAMNTSFFAEINVISCASAGNCTAAGGYGDDLGYQVFVVSQVDGVWGTVETIPSLNAANAGGDAAVRSVSCASPGNCSIGGIYADANYLYKGFLASQIDGVWQPYEEIPGFDSLSNFGYSDVSSVSCAEAGSCSAVGMYSTTDLAGQVFVTSISTPLPEPTTTTDAPATTSDAPLTTTVPSTSVSTTAPSTSVSSTLLVTNLPATGRGSSSTMLMSLMLTLSGVLIVSGLRRRIS